MLSGISPSCPDSDAVILLCNDTPGAGWEQQLNDTDDEAPSQVIDMADTWTGTREDA